MPLLSLIFFDSGHVSLGSIESWRPRCGYRSRLVPPSLHAREPGAESRAKADGADGTRRCNCDCSERANGKTPATTSVGSSSAGLEAFMTAATTCKVRDRRSAGAVQKSRWKTYHLCAEVVDRLWHGRFHVGDDLDSAVGEDVADKHLYGRLHRHDGSVWGC